jgi:phosphoribosylformylglycinamidine cyclo-ligase
MKKTALSYKKSGVDIEKADVFLELIRASVAGTRTRAVLKTKGGFGGLFAPDWKKYKNPVLVSSTDGVGTKLLLAKALGKHDTVGIDLVAMNVNDILCTGARPLFFLDYVACGKLNPPLLRDVVRGIAKGCQLSGASLIGGETAEMPGMYRADDYDLAGFAVGIVEKSKIIDPSGIKAGDRLLGLASAGLHSNGFSLVRKVFSVKEQKKYARQFLAPTRIYVRPVLDVIENVRVKGIAHITGGAFYKKLTRIVPGGKCFEIDRGAWPVPAIFQEIRKKGRISDREMFTTFNMGIGMVLVVAPKDVPRARAVLKRHRLPSWEIGVVVKGKEKIRLL